MLTRMRGTLERVEGLAATIASEAGDRAWEVLVPAFLAERLGGQLGRSVTLHTLEYLESQGQGTSFVPRILGFTAESDRRFFQLLTTVKGMGSKKTLKAMAAEPAQLASWISSHDVRALVSMPEIGKRLAETIIAELDGKLGPFLEDIPESARAWSGRVVEPRSRLPQSGLDAVQALVALGDTPIDAERKVLAVLARDDAPQTPEEIVTSALSG